MTQEQKDLLLKDLCARLPYGVKISIPELWISEKKIEVLNEIFKGDDGLYRVNDNGMLIELIKPYLFPLSSMTEEQEEELNKKFNIQLLGDNIYIYYHSQGYWDTDLDVGLQDWLWLINWCYKNHFDINGLIPKNLAIDATGLNIY